ncbi:MAG: Rne/Rng family ribonuclease [Chloracidobacterium sp.]|nr:Rne/Rng family ribonuclease [Chloracidobacterium sp.]
MAKELIVSVNGREKKIAILDNGKVTEFYIERGEENQGVAGNVYKGRVMRVLPGMQSAFVDIGLERDAFLYVSDFFDEEEEIERIVMEKGKKGQSDEAKREAREQVDRQRVEREKQMESAQEVADGTVSEPLSDEAVDEILPPPTPEDKPKRGRGRGKKAKDEPSADAVSDDGVEPIEIDFDASGFERISDDSDTGEMFKDAYMQEAIVDRVRAVEFDMESTGVAEVGSLLDDMGGGGFERIADEEEEAKPAKGRGKKAPAAKKPAAEKKPKAAKSPAKKVAEKKPKAASSRSKKKPAEGEEPLADAEASVRESDDNAEMAVRRGGRGRRRNVKPKGKAHANDDVDEVDGDELIENGAADIEAENSPESAETDGPQADEAGISEEETPEPAESVDTDDESENRSDNRSDRGRDRNDRDRNRRGSRGGRDRNGRSDGRRDRGPQPVISDLLKEGQEILVQIAKEPIAKKGARITSHIALPGRYLVYMPTIEHLGVSRKIESSNERGRLRTMLQKIRQDPDIPSGGFIVRTAGVGISEEDLRNDAKFLARSWQDAKKGSEKKKSPALIHQDLDLVQRLLRDQLADDFTAIRVDSEEEYLRTVEFMERMAPRMVNRVKLYTRDEPILDYYNVQEEIDKALKPRVWLKSGGYLVINQTEALVSIDVNTGKFVGKGNQRLEDTITRTNMEAVDEIARQIRLRDLGGILVLDLIDMEDRRNRHKVSQALQEALQKDKSPTKVLSFNDFGLIIMTRKRVKQSLERTMCAPCEYCESSGWVKSPTTVAYEILSEARRLSKQVEDIRHSTLRVHPEVSKALRSTEREVMEEIEHHLGNVDITSDRSVHQAQFDFAFI